MKSECDFGIISRITVHEWDTNTRMGKRSFRIFVKYSWMVTLEPGIHPIRYEAVVEGADGMLKAEG